MQKVAAEKTLVNENIINLSETEFDKVGVDSCGRIFRWEGRLFRAIRNEMIEEVRKMFSSGMIKALVDARLFPASWIKDYSIEDYGLVVEHELIKHVTYPFEWSFTMLKDAAVCALRTNIIARKYGYQTKDCHTYNICFDKTTPLFVDLGSFIRVNEKRGWIAYEDFLTSYYYPLSLWSKGNSFIARKLLFSLSLTEHMPHESFLLYKHPILRVLNLNRLRQAVSFYYRFRRMIPCRFVSYESLIKKINALSLKKSGTQWGDYHNDYYNEKGEPVSDSRFSRIIELVKGHKISSVIELGGNQGIFSEMLLKNTSVKEVTCTDYDEKAVDAMYKSAKKKALNMTPAVVDIMFPLMNYYETPPYERFKSDAVLALAVTHHIVLSQNITIDLFFEIVAKYSKKYVFIEYMPLGLHNGKTAPPLPPWYSQDWFKTAFEKFFTVHLVEQLDENRVLFFGELKEGK
jgi:hypothetical protein